MSTNSEEEKWHNVPLVFDSVSSLAAISLHQKRRHLKHNVHVQALSKAGVNALLYLLPESRKLIIQLAPLNPLNLLL